MSVQGGLFKLVQNELYLMVNHLIMFVYYLEYPWVGSSDGITENVSFQLRLSADDCLLL